MTHTSLGVEEWGSEFSTTRDILTSHWQYMEQFQLKNYQHALTVALTCGVDLDVK